jgi:hypothetical protein
MAKKVNQKKTRLEVATDSINTILQSNANFQFEAYLDLLSSVDVYKLRYAGVVPAGNGDHVAFLDLNDLIKLRTYIDIIIKESKCL